MESFNKQPSEKFKIEIDFSNLITSPETISSIDVKAYLFSTDVTSTVIDTSSYTGTSIYVTVKSGTDGLTYKITVKATTSTGNIFEYDVNMIVKDE